MQSSPPTRAWERPSSPAGSQYSLDLGALDLDGSNSGQSTPQPKQHVDQVLSEDIDGPTDFTINMGRWMKGGILGKGTANRKTGVLQSLKEQGLDELDNKSETSESVRELLSTRDGPAPSNHTPTGSPPKESVFLASARDNDGESDWDPYSERSTPKPPGHQGLQPTVEDYYSELMGNNHQAAHALPSSPTLSPVRSPVIERSAGSKIDMAEQLRRVQSKCQQLETLNQALGRALEEERTKRRQESAEHKRQSDDAERQMKELANSRDAANDDKVEIRRLKEEMGKMTSQHSQELRDLQHELALVRRNRDDAEEAARAHRAELDEIELNRLTQSLARPESSHREDTSPETKQSNGAEKELAHLKESHEQEAKRAEADKERLVQHTAELRQKLKDLRKQLFDEQTAHDAEVLRLEAARDQVAAPDPSEIEALRNELEAKQSLLNSLTIDRDSAQDDLAEALAAHESTKSQLADFEAVNAAMDARISDAMRRREAYWRGRLEKEERERTLMAKTLLHQWGRQEVGVGSPQGYEFKYIDRKSKTGV